MSMEWFRWHDGTVTDPKLALIAKKSGESRPVVIAVWAALLEQGSRAEQRGSIADFDLETMAVALDIEEDAIHAVIAALTAKGMIDEQRLTAWDKRQPMREDLNSSARVQAYRERQKQAETPGNAAKRDETPGNAAKRDETVVTPLDTDTDTDSDSDTEEQVKSAASAPGPIASPDEPLPAEPEPTAPASPEPTAPDPTARQAKAKPGKPPAEPLPDPPEWLPVATWQTYVDHRKAKGKAMTPSAATLTLKQLDKARGLGHDPVDMVESAIANGWTGCVFEKHHKPADPTPAAAAPPRNGTRYPPFDKNARLLTGNQSAIEEWLGNRSHETHVIEGECHEVH